MNATRSQLFSMLSEACELEHALSCSYLYAAFSLRQQGFEDWRDQQRVRLWAGQIYFVASQEMLHLAQAWNLLTAIGGTPYYFRPPFPQKKGYVPIAATLTLERFSIETLERFLLWEAPVEAHNKRAFRAIDYDNNEENERPYRSIGELYSQISEIMTRIPERELFIGDPAHQVAPQLIDFPDLVQVTDLKTAKQAIDRIKLQGEGLPIDREDCHFGIFDDIRTAMMNRLKHGSFDPAFPCVNNPSLRSSPAATRITTIETREVMEFFDEIYLLALRMLAWVFGPSDPNTDLARRFARAAITAMPILLKPLGESLATMNACGDNSTAGAAFSLNRHVPLPDNPAHAELIVRERLYELDKEATRLASTTALSHILPWLPEQMGKFMRIAGLR